MNTRSIAGVLAFLLAGTITSWASADTSAPEPDTRTDAPRQGATGLSLFTSAGYLGSSGASGAALGTGVRYAIGRHFALGLDLGYGLMATQTGMEDRWWFMPSMAVVMPARIAGLRSTFDLGAGLGLGTASGYGSWSEYSAHPFTATWEFQLEPTVRAHAIASVAVTPTLDVFARAEAAALVLPHGSSASVTDSTWVMLSVGARFGLL